MRTSKKKRRNHRRFRHRLTLSRRGHRSTGTTAPFVMVAGAGSGFKGKGVTDDPAGVTYWKVANGIRLTGKARVRQLPEQRADVAGQPAFGE